MSSQPERFYVFAIPSLYTKNRTHVFHVIDRAYNHSVVRTFENSGPNREPNAEKRALDLADSLNERNRDEHL